MVLITVIKTLNWEIPLKNVVGEVCIDGGQGEKTTFVIVTAQSAKNTDTAEQKGYDAGKKASGIKRHIVVDTQGLPHAIADVTDRAGTLVAFSNHQELERTCWLMAVMGQPFANDGLSSARLLSWERVEGYGETASENSIPACNV